MISFVKRICKIYYFVPIDYDGLAVLDPDLLSHVRRLRMPPAMLLLFVGREILSAAPAEQGLVNLGHVLEEPFNVGPFPCVHKKEEDAD